MSEKLDFVNFCISFDRRLAEIIRKITNPKKPSEITVEEEAILKVLHNGYEAGIVEFENDNRNAKKIKADAL